MRIAISAESQIDLSEEDLKKLNIHIVRMNIEKDGVNYPDNAFPLKELFEYTSSTNKYCHTAATNVGAYQEFFEGLLKEYDEIIHLSISSTLSCCYQNALIAREDNPKIHVIDTLSSCGGSALYAILAAQRRDEGKSVTEIIDELKRRIPKRECSFQIDSLEYIQRGGRCSKVTMYGANLLRIKPVIVCEEDGKLHLGKLHRGKLEKVVTEYFNEILARDNIDKSIAFMEYSTLDEKGLEFFEKCVNRVKEAGFERIFIGECTPIAAYHAGPNIIGLQYLHKDN